MGFAQYKQNAKFSLTCNLICRPGIQNSTKTSCVEKVSREKAAGSWHLDRAEIHTGILIFFPIYWAALTGITVWEADRHVSELMSIQAAEPPLKTKPDTCTCGNEKLYSSMEK